MEYGDSLIHNNDEIKWACKTGPNAFKIYDPAAPCVGLEEFCGQNSDITQCVNLPMKSAVVWQLAFDLIDITNARVEMKRICKFWKSHKEPAKRLPPMLLTHNLTFSGGPANRRCHGTCLALIMARRRRGVALPALPSDV